MCNGRYERERVEHFRMGEVVGVGRDKSTGSVGGRTWFKITLHYVTVSYS